MLSVINQLNLIKIIFIFKFLFPGTTVTAEEVDYYLT